MLPWCSLCGCVAELRKKIAVAVPPLCKLLGSGTPEDRSAAVSVLEKWTNHGEPYLYTIQT